MGDIGDRRFIRLQVQALVNFVQTPSHNSTTYTYVYAISFNSSSSPLGFSSFSPVSPQSPLQQALMSHHQGPVTAYPPPGQVYQPLTSYPRPGQVYPPPPSLEGQHQFTYFAAPPPATSYPPPGQVYPPPPPLEGQHQVIYVAAPPPVGYPMRDGAGHPQNHRPVETRSRGDGFWKGCAAALCCCCVLDCCF